MTSELGYRRYLLSMPELAADNQKIVIAQLAVCLSPKRRRVMVNVSYAREKLSVGLISLAKGSDPIQMRLWDAYMSFHPLRENDFPKDLQEDYKEIKDLLTKVKPKGDEGSVKATLSQMTEEEANIIAEKLAILCFEIIERGAKDTH